MRCSEIQHLLSDYADGAADERARRIAERHIQLCGRCRDGVLLARQLGQQLTRMPLLPLGVADRVPRLRRRLQEKLTSRGALRATGRVMKAMLALLAGMMIVAIWILSGAVV